MELTEIVEHFSEMLEDLQRLMNEGKLNSSDIQGFMMCLKIGDQIGANFSNSILELSEEERCNFISLIAHKLDISPQTYLDHLSGTMDTFMNIVRGKIKGR